MRRKRRSSSPASMQLGWLFATMALCISAFLFSSSLSYGFVLKVMGSDGYPASGFRYLIERDTTNVTVPGAPVSDSVSLDIHNSYAPVVTQGETALSMVNVDLPSSERYVVSVLPGGGFSMSGTVVEPGQTEVTVTVHRHPIPTAQISILAFMDHNLINNVFDEHDTRLGGCTVVLADVGGQIIYDAFGNLLGTTYRQQVDGSFVLDADGNPVVDVMGNGAIQTLTQEDFDLGNNPHNLKVGEAIVKYLVPGKYGVRLIPPEVDDAGNQMIWTQTATIEGTPTIDAWVKANEPKLFVEGFGTGFHHVFIGFVKVSPATSTYKGQTLNVVPWNMTPPAGSGVIEGTLRVNHFSRPPNTQGFFAGEPVTEGWVALNDITVQPGITPAGLYAAPCDTDTGHFRIENVPAGTYRLVYWDQPLDNLFGFHEVTIGNGENKQLGDVFVYQWFGELLGNVFNDINENGFQDCVTPECDDPFLDDVGISGQAVGIRFRDGTMYQATATDEFGRYSLSEVFPFFKWLVVEVGFSQFKATGMTSVVDYGGEVLPDNGWDWPSRNKLRPQPQALNNPNTGNNLSRTETGPILTQAMHLFLGQYNEINWGKKAYSAGENGGISGIVFYDTTIAENDPRYNAGEGWQPGIPRVQVNLYQDTNADGIIDDVNGVDGIQVPDVDNFPFDSQASPFPGPEDIDHNLNGVFDNGDAIQIATTDSWDDNKPSGCVQDLPVIHGQTIKECADAFGTWNQVRDGVFDGGYAFDGLTTGTYIVEVMPPRGESTQPMYKVVQSHDKNVDFGDPYSPSLLALPPVCVGDTYTVPAELSLFPGVPAPLAGTQLSNCDRKQVQVLDKRNAAADFFMTTVSGVPKSALAVGFVNNDLGAEFNMASPNFGEKLAAEWIPISIRDWNGVELFRVYSDEFGGYSFRIPSTYTVNVPSPSGVSPNMITIILNDPVRPDGTVDPYYNPKYSVTPWTFQYYPGAVSYLDTPLVPMVAFAAGGLTIDTEPADKTPMICSVDGPEPEVGPLICTDRANGRQIRITSAGIQQVLNPDYDANQPGSTFFIQRDYGFGTVEGSVTLDGQPLTINLWTDTEILATVPGGLTTGRLAVKRGDNQAESDVGVTLNIINCSTTVVWEVPLDFSTIQEAVDFAGPGDLILVAPGSYNENVVMYKPVRIQGSGPGCTIVNANPFPLERLDAWHAKVDSLGARDFVTFLLKDPFSESEAPGFIVIGETVYPAGNLQNPDPLITKTLNPGNPFSVPGQAAIDGFKILGSKAGGGIFALAGAIGLTITNNNITNNQGNYAGGIAVGTQDSGFIDTNNNNVVLRYNKIHKNGGVQGGGGISMNEDSQDYLIEYNTIHGNFSRFNGAGINQRGICPGHNVIQFNMVIFNENFFGALLNKAGEGGGIYIGGDVAAGSGAGNIDIIGNLIQGNLTGSGNGGGIQLFAINGDGNMDGDITSTNIPADWYMARIINNIIVNNVAGKAGGGIFLQDAVNVVIANNTIANNESTATSSLSFEPGAANSTPQGAGVVAAPNSAALQAVLDANVNGPYDTFSNPVLENNIIWHNRSWYNDASLNGGAGGLAVNPNGSYWDLLVQGSTLPGDPHLTPVGCLLSQQIDPETGFDYGAGNLYADPVFTFEYKNSLETATVLDEGGNSISVRYTPILPVGDYHLRMTSPAIDAGVSTANVPADDYDLDLRNDGTPDIGADEYVAGPKTIEDVVTDYYLSILNRAPDAGGLALWTSEIMRIEGLGIDIKEGFIALAQNFFNSSEYLGFGTTDTQYITDLYETFLNRTPSQAEIDSWLLSMSQGLTRDGVLLSFAYSTEFRLYMESLFGASVTRPENNLVNDFYRGFLARLPESAGFAFHVANMGAAQCAGAEAVRSEAYNIALAFSQSVEYTNRNRTNGQFVNDLYNAILRRGPDAAGYTGWVTLLDNATMTRDEMLAAFTNSTEFQTRVTQVINAGCIL